MVAYVAFIWTDDREVQGQWRYELSKSKADAWANSTGNSRGFENRIVLHNMRDIREFSESDIDENARRMFHSFICYANRSVTKVFED